MSTLMRPYDRWETEHRDCTMRPGVMNRQRAPFVLSNHTGHGVECQQYLAALSTVSTIIG